ncbi:hypothetical protein ACFTSF_31265 [Kribbella sp. NPDC056951]|uniref:hypothetical protein n=1 Tax=Kribbella sp. NPDC056951 TaxID=3345978 RepID=UPI0036418EBE
MMIGDSRYHVIGVEKFHQDLHFLRQQAKARPAVYLTLYREVLREIERLRTGAADGHHALGYEPGKGDLRDCVTVYVRSDPQAKADHRLVFREIGAAEPGQLPRRELLAIRHRRGTNNVYAHVCARLGRQVADRQPGLDRFGGREAAPGSNGSERRAELDVRRAIAHAWDGQQPLRSSRPLAGGTPRASGDGSAQVTRERPRGARAGATGWPERG